MRFLACACRCAARITGDRHAAASVSRCKANWPHHWRLTDVRRHPTGLSRQWCRPSAGRDRAIQPRASTDNPVHPQGQKIPSPLLRSLR
jgi:hypothetical protein